VQIGEQGHGVIAGDNSSSHITEPKGIGGLIARQCVAEPDVVCDFAQVWIVQTDPEHVRVMGALCPQNVVL
jgi:hypothetical protein